ncbi:MAG: hypothetical protein CM15mV7_2460 [uncultured marine virus]|nr:MAG: hypothetical protein CM15mV7_2460 [uncultured marine virus]
MTGALGAPDQNVFTVIGTDNNSKTASSTSTTINFVGGTGISTDVAGDNLTITNSSPNVVQNVLQGIAGDSGSYTANASDSTITIAGGNGLSSSVSSNTLTIQSELYLASGFSTGENKTLIFGNTGLESVASAALGWVITSNGSSAYRFAGLELVAQLTIQLYICIEDLLIDSITKQVHHIHLNSEYQQEELLLLMV